MDIPHTSAVHSQFCQSCNAWRGSLGLEPTPELFVQHIVQIFRELKRVLRDDGTLWLNLGDSYCSTAPGTRGAPGQLGANSGFGRRTAYHLANQRPETPENMKPKDLVGIPWAVAFALRKDGWYLRSDIIWHKPNPMPESVTDRPTKAHEYIFLLSKNQKYFYDAEAIKEESTGQNGSAANFKRDSKDHIIPGQSKKQHRLDRTNTKDSGKRNKRSVWTIPTHPMPDAHFATFPPKLVEPCVLAGSPVVCCPDCGTGWERIVEKDRPPESVYTKTNRPLDGLVAAGTRRNGVVRGSGQAYTNWKNGHPDKTTGFRPTCSCYDELYQSPTEFPEAHNTRKRHQRSISGDHYIRSRRRPGHPDWKTTPAMICDPFGGAATSAIVAQEHGRNFTIIELSEKYLSEIAIPRITDGTGFNLRNKERFSGGVKKHSDGGGAKVEQLGLF